jgi:PAS domain S-box-containing protein
LILTLINGINDIYHIFEIMENHLLPTYEAIFEACEEGIVVVKSNGRIVLANSSSTILFGYTKEVLQTLYVEDLIPKKARGNHGQHREKYVENPSPRRMGKGRDLNAVKKDGTEFPVEISLNQVFLNDEFHTVAFIIDISERKLIEAALRNSEEQLIVYATELEKRVSDRTKELDESIKNLENTNSELEEQVIVRKKAEEEAKIALERERELNELKSRFVSMASHEFRTPLSTILSSASLISKYTTTDTEEKRGKHVGKIKSSIENLNNILNDFLSLAKLEEGKTNILTSNFDLVQLIKEVVSDMETVLKRGQKISFELSGDSKVINTDKKHVRNILINLISNAIKYSAEDKPIAIKLEFESTKTTVEIIDAGIGIPLNEQKHLFERFFRAKNAVNIQGTGLGLNIVKKYIEMLNGSISFETKENVGTRFKITLPV